MYRFIADFGVFLSTPSARRATIAPGLWSDLHGISIHALREEGDHGSAEQRARPSHFYPRPPRGGRLDLYNLDPRPVHFYPRPPRGGRRQIQRKMHANKSISIHALREEGDRLCGRGRNPGDISIHALREEGDLPVKPKRRGDVKFLSTPSARRATREPAEDNFDIRNFYPRPPRGGRPRRGKSKSKGDRISIHALREEGDLIFWASSSEIPNFYPRPPRGGRR